MPYVAQDRRELIIEQDVFDGSLVVSDQCCDVGDLNFAISTLVKEYLERTGLKYANINAVIGVLECAKMELYRRIAAPYEDTKIESNGDIYGQA